MLWHLKNLNPILFEGKYETTVLWLFITILVESSYEFTQAPNYSFFIIFSCRSFHWSRLNCVRRRDNLSSKKKKKRRRDNHIGSSLFCSSLKWLSERRTKAGSLSESSSHRSCSSTITCLNFIGFTNQSYGVISYTYVYTNSKEYFG